MNLKGWEALIYKKMHRPFTGLHHFFDQPSKLTNCNLQVQIQLLSKAHLILFLTMALA